MATAIGISATGVLPAEAVELLRIALDAYNVHMYVHGMRRYINSPPKAGATTEEIVEVLKFCATEGVQACNPSVPVLDEAIVAVSATEARP